MTPDDRDRLRELAESATPGPWLWMGEEQGERSWEVLTTDPGEDHFRTVAARPAGWDMVVADAAKVDAAYIAAAHPQAVLALLDDLRDAEARDRRVLNALARIDGHTCHDGHTDADHLRLYRQVVQEVQRAVAPDPPAGT